MLKDDVVMFIAHLDITIKHLTRYKQKVVLAAMCHGQEYAANTNHTTSLKNQSTLNGLKCVSFQILGVR